MYCRYAGAGPFVSGMNGVGPAILGRSELVLEFTSKVSSSYHLCIECFSQLSFDFEMYTKSAARRQDSLPLVSSKQSYIVVPGGIDLRGASPKSNLGQVWSMQGQAQGVGQVSFGGTLSIQYIVREQQSYIVVPGCIDLRGAWPKSELPVKAALVLLLCLSLCTCCYRLVQLLQLCRGFRERVGKKGGTIKSIAKLNNK